MKQTHYNFLYSQVTSGQTNSITEPPLKDFPWQKAMEQKENCVLLQHMEAWMTGKWLIS